MDLVFIRHGLPEPRQTTDGSPADPPLSSRGHAQARAVAAWLAPEEIDAIYTSPMRRATQTAAPMATTRGLDAKLSDGISEFDRHADAYVPMEELKLQHYDRWLELVSGMGQDMGDPVEFRRVVVDTVDAIISAHRGESVVVFCHGGVINAYASHILGRQPAEMFFFEPAYTSVNRVLAAATGQRTIVSLNETAHLRDLSEPAELPD